MNGRLFRDRGTDDRSGRFVVKEDKMTRSALEPLDMRWVEQGVLGIDWSDGHEGRYPIRHLRLHCPCAACTDEWTGELKLKPDDVPMLIRMQDVEPVGRYALRFTFSDGHDTGIYSFSFLRKLCQCQLCQPVKAEQSKTRRLL